MPSRTPEPSSESPYAALAAQHGLVRQGVRGPLLGYIKQMWRSRQFMWTLGVTRTYSRNENTYLGQFWAIINPLVFAAVYYVVFGYLLGTNAGVKNFEAFLIVGVFIFGYCAQALTAGAGAVTGNVSLIRSLRFPRAALPISVVITEFLTLLPAIAVMLVLVSVTGERPSWEWLMMAPMFIVITLFNVGIALFTARLVNQYKDLKNVITHVTRVLRYASGVFFLISNYVSGGVFGLILEYQPYALALTVIRESLLGEFAVSWGHAIAMAAWALLATVGGLIYFWRGEGRYGLD